MQATVKIYVIGIGFRPLDKRAQETVRGADVILASKRHFEIFRGLEVFETVRDKVIVNSKLEEVFDFIKAAISNPQSEIKNIVFLASGDPLFFGIGKKMISEFGKEAVEIMPDLSSIQLAFARIKEAWDNVLLVSVHGGPDQDKRRALKYNIEDIPLLLERHHKIAMLTDKINNPSVIAKEFLKPSALRLTPSSFRLYVCEKIGYPEEKITEGSPEDIAASSFADPNVVIIQKLFQQSANSRSANSRGSNHGAAVSPQPSAFGLRETDIIHSRGLITKDEVRAVTIHKLQLPVNAVFWDIGAGSGSISIEIARLYPLLKVFAIERDEEQIENIKKNRIKFDIRNIEIIQGEAPEALSGLPVPDRVFIGGSGKRLTNIIKFVATLDVRLIVINAATIETLTEALQALENNGFNAEISEISVSRSKNLAGRKQMEALNPVFIITGEQVGA